MSKTQVTLVPLKEEDREQFILDNQKAFKYGATEEFGVRDEHFEEDGEIISRETIEQSIDNGEAFRIIHDGKSAGGGLHPGGQSQPDDRAAAERAAPQYPA